MPLHELVLYLFEVSRRFLGQSLGCAQPQILPELVAKLINGVLGLLEVLEEHVDALGEREVPHDSAG
jgi:hypothetical protein